MPKNSRRKTVAARLSRDAEANRSESKAARRQTTGTVSIHRSGNPHHQYLKVNKPQEEPKKKRTRQEDCAGAFEDQLSSYKNKLIADLNDDFTNADIDLGKSMSDLAHEFDVKCIAIEKASNILTDDIVNEQLEFDSKDGTQAVVLGYRMAEFKALYEKKQAQLRKLWQEYEEVQNQIMELSLVILDPEDVQISETQTVQDDGNPIPEDKRKHIYPDLDEDRANLRAKEFREGYDVATTSLNELGEQLENLTAKTLEDNTSILKAFERGQTQKKKELAGYLKAMEDY